MTFDICVVGDLKRLLWLSPTSPEDVSTRLVKITRLPGNDATIVALLAAQAGIRCCHLPTNAIARKDGQPLLALLQRAGVNTSFIDTDGPSTPLTIGVFDPILNERRWSIEPCPFRPFPSPPPACTFAYIDLYDDYLQERFEILHSLSTSTGRSLINLSATNHQLKLTMLASLPQIDMIQMGSNGDLTTALEQARQARQVCNARAIVVTAGKHGAVLVEQSPIQGMPYHEYVILAQPIQPLRTIGAGASFSAGFLQALHQNETYEEAVRAACRYAADFCTSPINSLEVSLE